MPLFKARLSTLLIVASVTLAGVSLQAGTPIDNPLDCGTGSLHDRPWDGATALETGDLQIPPAREPSALCLDPAHLFLFEDTEGVLSDPEHTEAQLRDLMVEAANRLIQEHGDHFDFIGFWTDLDPAARFGRAHYLAVANDTAGIGSPLFDRRDTLGLDSERVDGMVQMYDVHRTQRGNVPELLAHELSHRWIAYLDPLQDGRTLAHAHFDCRLDVQGGAHGTDWHGSDPANDRDGWKNQDTGARFSWLDLYLMGYADLQELDSGTAEMRYLDANTECSAPYRGTITTLDVSEIETSNGLRQPTPATSQKDFRAAWIVVHPAGRLPEQQDLSRIARILEDLSLDWQLDTLGRGTLDHQLFDDCNCNGLDDAEELEADSSLDADADGLLDECR